MCVEKLNTVGVEGWKPVFGTPSPPLIASARMLCCPRNNLLRNRLISLPSGDR